MSRRLVELSEWTRAVCAEPKAGERYVLPDDASLRSTSFVARQFVGLNVRAADTIQRILEICISDESVDRYDSILKADGWMLDNYRKNPVVLFGHCYDELPIGKDTGVRLTDGRKLIGRPQFAPREMNPLADSTYLMLLGGYLNASSVGFLPLEWTFDEGRNGYNIIRQELLEYSIVPVPANPNALIEARSAGINIDPIRDWAVELLDHAGAETSLIVPRRTLERAYRIVVGERTFSLPSFDVAALPADASPIAVTDHEGATVLSLVRADQVPSAASPTPAAPEAPADPLVRAAGALAELRGEADLITHVATVLRCLGHDDAAERLTRSEPEPSASPAPSAPVLTDLNAARSLLTRVARAEFANFRTTLSEDRAEHRMRTTGRLPD